MLFFLTRLVLGPRGMVFLGLLQPGSHLLDFLGGRFDACLTLLLKDVQDIDDTFELDRVDGPIRAPALVFNHLQKRSPAKPFHWLGIGVLFPGLGIEESLPESRANSLRELPYVLAAGSHPVNRLGLGWFNVVAHRHVHYALFGMSPQSGSFSTFIVW